MPYSPQMIAQIQRLQSQYRQQRRPAAKPGPVYQTGSLARQVFNPGKHGQDARYDVSGLGRNAAGNLWDGTYEYDSDGRDLSGRPKVNIAGLRGADDMNGWTPGMPMPNSGGGGGGGYTPSGVYGADVARAKLAYDRAVSRSKEGIQRLNQTTGFKRVGDKTEIDPYNQYGSLRMLLQKQGGQLDDAQAAAMERGLSGRGLGAQMQTQLRHLQGGEMNDLATQYQNAYKQYLQDESDALAEFKLAEQMAMFDAVEGGESWYDGGGDLGLDSSMPDYGDPFAPLADADPAKLAAALRPVKKSNAKALAKSVYRPTNKGWGNKATVSKPTWSKPAPPPKPAPKPKKKGKK